MTFPRTNLYVLFILVFPPAFNITISGSGAADTFFTLDSPPSGKLIYQQYAAATEASGNSFCQQLTGQSLLLIIGKTCSIWAHGGMEIVMRDRGNGRGRGSCKSRAKMEWLGWAGVAGGSGLKRDRQVHRGERNVVHLSYLILSGPWGVGHKIRREKERRAVRRREMATKYVYEHASMQRCDQGCTLSALFSCYICYMTAVCESVTDLNSNSKKCKKKKKI